MKGRLNTTVWRLIGINGAALILVIGLAYGAGARSGGLSLRDFGALPQAAGFELLGAIFFAVITTVVLLVVLGGRVLTPVASLLDFSSRLAAEDYSAQPENMQNGNDFGVIADNCGRLAERLARAAQVEGALASLQQKISEFQNTLSQAARGDLTVRTDLASDELGAVPETFNNMMENLSKRLERVRSAAGEISAGAGQVLSATNELHSAAGQQEQEVAGVSAVVEELAEAAREATASAASAAETARRTLEIVEQGNRAITEAAGGTERIRIALGAATERIAFLVERSLEVYEVINIINDTNLMAMNAAIEASRAGDAKGLDVLSEQLHKLGEHSRKATKDVVTLLKSMQADANEAAAMMEQAKRAVEAGAQLGEQAGKSVAAISSSLQKAGELVNVVAATARQQTKGGEALAAALQSLAAKQRQTGVKVRQATTAAEQAAKSADQVTVAAAVRTGPAARPELVAGASTRA